MQPGGHNKEIKAIANTPCLTARCHIFGERAVSNSVTAVSLDSMQVITVKSMADLAYGLAFTVVSTSLVDMPTQIHISYHNS